MFEVQDEVEVGTKRGMECDEYDEQVSKVAKSDGIEVRLLLLGRNCGGIIGKGGANITRLRTNYGVHVRMPSTQTPDRPFTVNGSFENCLAVVKEVLTHSTQVPYSTHQQCSMELNLLVQTNTVGSILGKGGARITEMRESTNAKFKIYEECLPNSNERVIAIGGDSEEQLIMALTKILHRLQEEPNRSKTRYYDPSLKSSGMPPVIKSNEHKGGPTKHPVMPHVQNTWGNNNHSLMGGGYMGNTPFASGGGIQPLMAGGHANADKMPNASLNFMQLQTVTSITTPNEMCGAIIGKGGSRIREVRDISGAKITFSESAKESKEDRVVTIAGTQQQVQMAEHLIAQYMCNT